MAYTYDKRRCQAETGVGRQCQRSGVELRDGQDVCAQHGDAPRVWFVDRPREMIEPEPIVPADILEAEATVAGIRDKIEEATRLTRLGIERSQQERSLARQVAMIAASDDGPEARRAQLEALLAGSG